MRNATAVIGTVGVFLLAGCARDRSAPLSEVEHRAVERSEAAAAAAQQPAQHPRQAVKPEPQPVLEPAEAEPTPTDAERLVVRESEPVATAEQAVVPSYAAVAKLYNERIARLPRIWGRAVVSATFTDENRRERYEQGDGHLQFQRPHFLALDIGKAGETLFWLGCDNDRFWVFDLQKDRTSYVGKIADLTRERAAELGLPALPQEFPMIMGIAPLPTDANATIRSIDKGKAWRISLPPRNGIVTRLVLDPKKVWPTRVEQLSLDGEVVLESELSNYHQVSLAGVGGFFPQVPGMTHITHRASGTSMKIQLEDPLDDRALKPVVFDYDHLKQALSAGREVVIDNQPLPAGQ